MSCKLKIYFGYSLHYFIVWIIKLVFELCKPYFGKKDIEQVLSLLALINTY